MLGMEYWMNKVITAENLTREYVVKKKIKGKNVVTAVDNISFDVFEGEVFGFLGQNGAGKTTTIKILTTLLLPTKGRVLVLGHDVDKEEKEIRKKINFVYGGERSLYWRLTGRENLIYFSMLYNVHDYKSKIEEIIKKLKLAEYIDKRVETYSKGMKQKLQIAKGLVNDPKILFLDEPTIGLDPIAANDLRYIIKELSNKGTTIFFTTHYMDEAEKLCDRIALIKKGNIVALDTPKNLIQQNADFNTLEVSVKTFQQKWIDEIAAIEGIINVGINKKDAVKIVIKYKTQIDIPDMVINIIKMKNIINTNLRTSSLEDVYVKLIGDQDEK